MTKKSLQEKSKKLQKAFLLLKTETEVFNFLIDLCTISEIEEFSQRFDIAERLIKKESYKSIEEKIGVSSTTIARVAKFLNGKWGGYKQIFDRMNITF